MRVFVAYPVTSSFVERDLKTIREKHEVVARNLKPLKLSTVITSLIEVARCDLVFFWFASLRNLPLMLWASLLRRRQVVIVGGYEAANLPELDYGAARPGWKRGLTRFMLKRAEKILAVSKASADSISKNLDIDPDRVELLYHGFDDPGEIDSPSRENLVVTIGVIDDITWLRKGIKDFIEIAAVMPDLHFLHIGAVTIDVEKKLGRPLPDNLKLLGKVPFSRLGQHLCRAKVYVQASRHESFGCAGADAMLFGCIPVVSNLFSLPEVVGDCGVILKSLEQKELQAGIRSALTFSEADGVRCRKRILSEFPGRKRADRLLSILQEIGGRRQ